MGWRARSSARTSSLLSLWNFSRVALDERRFDGAGADGVDAERLRVFNGKLAGHGDNGAFGGAVSEALPDADESRDGGDVDDGADRGAICSGSKKQAQKGARNKVDRADIDVEKAVEVVGFRLFYGSDVADARVVDQNVEAGELGRRRRQWIQGW